ncbi:uncharacterized protein FIESC28_00399 [Fusarium coffeatum]|uniref:Uncharacterized protein n=1 Tax=Fusarium coffeatum TaxID=231269 RepID=A0A366SD42_9HYPO|nr:uncharacterized protein FIESC28_00399 [Fusarium coffeatum]RBR26818.1 hypothetical protein FIESC28_00399 [Fusarium coffeatum]
MEANPTNVCLSGENPPKNDGDGTPLPYSPSPPPPAPPLPICVQRELPKLFSDETKSFDDMVKEAEADIYSVQKKTRDILLDIAAPRSFRGIPYPKLFDDDWLSKLMDFVNTDHLKQMKEKMQDRACDLGQQEPKFMPRTRIIKFLDPATFASSREGRQLEMNGWVRV